MAAAVVMVVVSAAAIVVMIATAAAIIRASAESSSVVIVIVSHAVFSLRLKLSPKFPGLKPIPYAACPYNRDTTFMQEQ
jgi:hypothetical protein